MQTSTVETSIERRGPSLTGPASLVAGVGRWLVREPLAHFLGLAALLFLGNAVLSGDGREVITVDLPTQEYLVRERQELLLRDMTGEEMAEVIDAFIEEEILVREARKRGYGNSARIRSLLVQNMRFFMTSEVPEPTDEDLRAFFAQNPGRFETEPTVTYDHVYFSEPDSAPADTLEALRAGADHRQLGDGNAFTARLDAVGERAIVANFGREVAPRILGIADARWHGPFPSANGVHFLRVAERHGARRPDFEAARGWLAREWRLAESREIVERELAEMRESYRIEVHQGRTPPR